MQYTHALQTQSPSRTKGTGNNYTFANPRYWHHSLVVLDGSVLQFALINIMEGA